MIVSLPSNLFIWLDEPTLLSVGCGADPEHGPASFPFISRARAELVIAFRSASASLDALGIADFHIPKGGAGAICAAFAIYRLQRPPTFPLIHGEA
jgi:hypothetical protein